MFCYRKIIIKRKMTNLWQLMPNLLLSSVLLHYCVIHLASIPMRTLSYLICSSPMLECSSFYRLNQQSSSFSLLVKTKNKSNNLSQFHTSLFEQLEISSLSITYASSLDPSAGVTRSEPSNVVGHLTVTTKHSPV